MKSAAQFWLKQEAGPIIHKNVITVHDVNEALQEICFCIILILIIIVFGVWDIAQNSGAWCLKKNARSKLKIWGKL